MKKCWKTKMMMGGQSLRWNGVMKAYLEVNDDDE
jgi:hypothetical protein